MRPGGPSELLSQVLKAGLCTGCGACLGYCPYLQTVEDRVALVENCGLAQGRCYQGCPRTTTDLPYLDHQAFGDGKRDPTLGRYRELIWARASSQGVRSAAQYGGAVTALITFALETGRIEGAVLARRSVTDPLGVEPVVARNAAEALECAGSKYTAAPTLSALNRYLVRGPGRLAVVGRGCQVTALRKLQSPSPGHLEEEPVSGDRLGLLIGLFCMWALDLRSLKRYIATRVEPTSITKIDIPRDRFVVYSNGHTYDLPLEEIKRCIVPACNNCYDVTAELSDISVGSTERDDDWCSLIVRSERGLKLVNDAVAAGVLEGAPFPREREEALRQAVAGKKGRVAKALSAANNGYLTISLEEARLFS